MLVEAEAQARLDSDSVPMLRGTFILILLCATCTQAFIKSWLVVRKSFLVSHKGTTDGSPYRALSPRLGEGALDPPERPLVDSSEKTCESNILGK